MSENNIQYKYLNNTIVKDMLFKINATTLNENAKTITKVLEEIINDILVTGAGGGIAQGIIKSLKMIEDVSIKIIAADANKLASGLYSANKSYVLPKYNSTSFKEKLVKVLLDEKIDYYIPGTDYELSLVLKIKNYLLENMG